MNGLQQVRQAVIDALNGAGLKAVPAFDGAAARHTGAVAAVDVGAVSGKPAGLGNYLGQQYDEKAGTVRELYGRQLDLKLTLDIRAERAGDCEAACETAAEVLFAGGLPSGLRMGEQSWEAVCWDKKNQTFLRKGAVEAKGFFTASVDEESGRLLEFTLKGVLIQ